MWYLSMRQSTHDTSETLGPWLRKNRTTNPYLAREREAHTSDIDWSLALSTPLTDTPNLFPYLIAALDQMRWEDDFMPPQTPYSRVNVRFATQRNMYQERDFNHERRLWSLIYYDIQDPMAGMGFRATPNMVPVTGNESE